MEGKKRTIKLGILFILGVYLISGIGYFIWFSTSELGALINILAPSVMSLIIILLSKRAVTVDFKSNALGSSGIGILIALAYIAVSIIITLIFRGELLEFKFTTKIIITSLVTYIFGAICEEIGWRGTLLPLLRKVTSYPNACLLTGVIWAGWHVPMILNKIILNEFTLPEGMCLFLLETISMTFIMGAVSETKYGKSIWAFVAMHAVHNIVLAFFPENQSKLFCEGGYVLAFTLLVFAIILNYLFVWRKNKIKAYQNK